ncbi:helix-turn-helix domain-containing protein, partial [bacterium]|nr:helix-turn-helix domain-containing protein [bacterium]
MAIEINLDLMLVKRKMRLTELAERIGISVTNLSLLKTGKVKGI